MYIRKAELSDGPALESLNKAAFPSFQQFSKRALLHSLKSPAQEVFVFEINGNSTIIAGVIYIMKYSKSIRIVSLATLPSFQNKGIGTHLLKSIYRYARHSNFDRISLEVLSKNSALVEWYQSKGFAIAATIKDYYGPRINAYKMELLIPPARRSATVTRPFKKSAA